MASTISVSPSLPRSTISAGAVADTMASSPNRSGKKRR
jgi:hypothetical protein